MKINITIILAMLILTACDDKGELSERHTNCFSGLSNPTNMKLSVVPAYKMQKYNLKDVCE